ncbi:hypothetical protein ABZ348_25005 [Streptomyces sp. NPDC005963]|uniref:hypothetical protein n=1 Tax=Streptomyces sp. NPDC005963 TaxID=3156721 RepID=UPI0033F4054A
MSSRPSAELIVTSPGSTARFDGERLWIERERTRWTVPLQAIDSVRLTKEGSQVSITLTGHGREADHGLAAPVSIPSSDPYAAEVFSRGLRRALAEREPADDGHALVTREALPRRPARFTATQRWSAALVTGWLAVLVVVGLVSRAPAAMLSGLLLVVAWTMPLGTGVLVNSVRHRIRPARVLRRRGLTVPGRMTGQAVRKHKDSRQSYPLLAFTTVDGTPFQDIRSVVSVHAPSDDEQAIRGAVDVTYDPENPALAACGRTVSHAGWTAALTVFGAVLTVFSVVVVGVLLTR